VHIRYKPTDAEREELCAARAPDDAAMPELTDVEREWQVELSASEPAVPDVADDWPIKIAPFGGEDPPLISATYRDRPPCEPDPLRWAYDDGGRGSAGLEFNFEDEINECVTRAIAIATGRAYGEVYDMVDEFGRAAGHLDIACEGVPFELTRELMSEIGWRWVPLRNASLVTGSLPDEPRLIADMPGHVCAIIDGVVRDKHDCTWNDNEWPARVLGVYLLSLGRSEYGARQGNQRRPERELTPRPCVKQKCEGMCLSISGPERAADDDFDPYFDCDDDNDPPHRPPHRPGGSKPGRIHSPDKGMIRLLFGESGPVWPGGGDSTQRPSRHTTARDSTEVGWATTKGTEE
jgi:hypothetical protein